MKSQKATQFSHFLQDEKKMDIVMFFGGYHFTPESTDFKVTGYIIIVV